MATRGNDSAFETRATQYSVCKAIAHAIDPSIDAGFEREYSQEIAHRSGRKPDGIFVPHGVFQRAATTTTEAGSLVPTTHRPDLFIDRLKAILLVERLGARVLNDLVGDQSIPKLTTGATGYWLGEGADVTESQHAFEAVTLSPTTVAGLLQYTRRMLLNAVPAVEQLVRDDLANVVATAIDSAALVGTGANDQPTGIVNTSNVNVVSMGTPDGGAPTHAKVLEMVASHPERQLERFGFAEFRDLTQRGEVSARHP